MRDRIYEWLARLFGWADDYHTAFLYLGPEYLDRPLYQSRSAFMDKIGELRRHYLDEGALRVEVQGDPPIDVFTEQGGRRVVRMVIEIGVWR